MRVKFGLSLKPQLFYVFLCTLVSGLVDPGHLYFDVCYKISHRTAIAHCNVLDGLLCLWIHQLEPIESMKPTIKSGKYYDTTKE